jgi:hypothetical protein
MAVQEGSLKPAHFVCVTLLLFAVGAPAQNSPTIAGQRVAQEPRSGLPPSLFELPGVVRTASRLSASKATSPLSGTLQTSGLNFAATSYAPGGFYTNSVAVADVNGDGKPDIIVANFCASSTLCTEGEVGVLLGNGDGTFQTAVAYPSGGYQAASVAVADVNGDGKPDLLVANICDPNKNLCGSPGGTGSVGVLLGNGDGTFQAAVAYPSGGCLPFLWRWRT